MAGRSVEHSSDRSAGPAPLLDVKGIGKRFSGISALEDVDLQLLPGEVLGLLGANGSGKSTLSRLIAGEMRADKGEVAIAGRPLQRASPKAAARLGVAMAHQHPSLAPHLPVWETIFLGSEHCVAGGFLDRKAARAAAGEVLSRLGADVDPNASTGDLGAAGQQWVEIARAVTRKPRLLILDEPTAAMSAQETATLFAAVRRLTTEGISVIFISHRLQEVEELCSRIVVLRNGRNVGSWPTSGRLDVERILQLMSEDKQGVREVRLDGKLGDVVLAIEDLRSGTAVRGVDLALRRGEVLGIAGLQGQGQEELLEAIAGLHPYQSGALRCHGTDVKPQSPRDMLDRGVCLVPNDRRRQGLFIDEDVGSNLRYVAIAKTKHGWRLPPRSLGEFVSRVIGQLSIKTRGPTQVVSTLSGGNQQKIVVGKWLSIPFDVILLSDPTKGVDIHARSEIYTLVRELVAADRAAIVYASDLHELLEHCSRIVVMYEGRIVADLAGEAMTEPRITAASFGQVAAGTTP